MPQGALGSSDSNYFRKIMKKSIFCTIMRSPEGASFHWRAAKVPSCDHPKGRRYHHARRAAKYHHAITRRGVVSPASSQGTIMQSPEGASCHRLPPNAITRRGFPSRDHPEGRMSVGACEVPFSAGFHVPQLILPECSSQGRVKAVCESQGHRSKNFGGGVPPPPPLLDVATPPYP